ncbi:unnamed protein product, partial [Amoebophrya sp. A25]|eukprot:GSA25T00008236001.1
MVPSRTLGRGSSVVFFLVANMISGGEGVFKFKKFFLDPGAGKPRDAYYALPPFLDTDEFVNGTINAIREKKN